MLHCLQAGWNKLPCNACGTNVLTDVANTNELATSADQCVIPPGYGSSIDATGKLVARKCLLGHYGAPEAIYGIQPHPCQVGGVQQLGLGIRQHTPWCSRGLVHAAAAFTAFVTQHCSAVHQLGQAAAAS